MRPQCQAWMPNGTRCKSPGKRDDKVNAYVCEKHQGKRGLKFARLGQWTHETEAKGPKKARTVTVSE